LGQRTERRKEQGECARKEAQVKKKMKKRDEGTYRTVRRPFFGGWKYPSIEMLRDPNSSLASPSTDQ